MYSRKYGIWYFYHCRPIVADSVADITFETGALVYLGSSRYR